MAGDDKSLAQINKSRRGSEAIKSVKQRSVGPTELIQIRDTMTKLKTWVALARSFDADWTPRQMPTISDLVAVARAADWDSTNWCDANGYDASDPDARNMFECLLAYARGEGRTGLH